MAAEGGYLGQMGDADNLTVGMAHLLHDLGHHLGHAAAHTGVNLVEDDGGELDRAADHGFQREHDAGDLTAGCDLCNGLHGGASVGAEEEGYLVGSFLGELFGGGDVNGKAHVGDAEGNEAALHLFLHLLGGLLPEGCQGGGMTEGRYGGVLLLAAQGFNLIAAVIEMVELLPELVAQGNELFDGLYVVLLLQGVDGVELFVDGIEAFGVEVGMGRHLRDFCGDVFQFDIAALDALCHFCGIGIDVADAFDGARCFAQAFHKVAFVAAKDSLGGVERGLDVFHMAEGLAFLFEFFLLAWGELGIVELVVLEAEEVFVLGCLGDVFFHPHDGPARFLIAAE